ncbi:MAG TPA: homoserine dehydrogenase [Acidimicrobiales bacterium]|nr:homoserine dehydrogenase [Acidimicrobiales bacterium]
MSSEPVRVGLLGCGNVGGALVHLLATEADSITARTGLRIEVARVAVRNVGKERGADLDPALLTHDAAAVATAPDVDVVVEVIGGIEPARGLILSALKSGKPVVTANKELLANVGTELAQVAAANGVDLLYEASVAGGIPLIRPLRESLAGERIHRVVGIVNGTTNYILTRMTEEGATYVEALAEAQSLGYAERDPTADVEGFDASAKAAIIATVAFGAEVVAGDVYREGISGVTADDIAVADRLGYVVKLLAVAEKVTANGAPAVTARVHPTMVPKDHPLASVRGSFNAVFIEGEAVGELMLYGRGAGGMPTASAVLGDLIDAAHNLRAGGGSRTALVQKATVVPIDELVAQYYLNVDVVDRPGVLAAVATVFGEHSVSIRSMEQAGLGDEARLIFITHSARERDMQATVAGLHQLDAVKRVGSLLRVLGAE